MLNSLAKQLKSFYLQLRAKRYSTKEKPLPKKHDVGEIYVFIRSWNRPLYTWTCLDNLYRHTDKSVKFVLIDNASDDLLVKEVIHGFERRSMFHAVHYMERNHGINQQLVFKQYRKHLGKYFFLLDADITIESSHEWTTTMIDQAERHPKLSLIGSYVDTKDFIDFEYAKTAFPQFTDGQIHCLTKGKSVERNIPPITKEIIRPFSPPGRLLLIKTETIDQVGLPIGNTNLCYVIKAAGYDYGISTRVHHRHLSLLNIYDYPDYDFKQLNKYLTGQ